MFQGTRCHVYFPPRPEIPLRLLAKSPGFAAAAIAVLALGIGLHTAMFSIVNALAFSPRPFPEKRGPASIEGDPTSTLTLATWLRIGLHAQIRPAALKQ